MPSLASANARAPQSRHLFVATPPSADPRSLDELRADNVRLRALLQNMEIDRLRAVNNALPVEEANLLTSSIWSDRVIQVSWENPEAAPDSERQLVRDAIEQTWQAESGLRFIYWGPAQADTRGIRIRIADDQPRCERLGNKLDGLKSGMVLNFTFANWCPNCSGPSGRDRLDAIRKVAVHEFGHAIGFAHEQNRSDTPPTCRSEPQGTSGDWYVTIYDPQSIMNYCNPEWNNAGLLSELDKVAVRTIYGAPRTQ